MQNESLFNTGSFPEMFHTNEHLEFKWQTPRKLKDIRNYFNWNNEWCNFSAKRYSGSWNRVTSS